MFVGRHVRFLEFGLPVFWRTLGQGGIECSGFDISDVT